MIPIVFALAADPLGSGLAASLARPGSNVTGLSTLQTDIVGKRLELLREVLPGLRRLAIWGNAGNPGNVVEMADVAATARTLGLEVATQEIWRAESSEQLLSVNKVCNSGTEYLRVAYPLRGSQDGGVPAMPTARQHRQQAKQCLELAKAAKDFYVKEAMAELAEELSKMAELLEHPTLGR